MLGNKALVFRRRFSCALRKKRDRTVPRKGRERKISSRLRLQINSNAIARLVLRFDVELGRAAIHDGRELHFHQVHARCIRAQASLASLQEVHGQEKHV